MFEYNMLGFIVSVPLAIVGGLSVLFGGMFAGSQIDDKVEQTQSPEGSAGRDLLDRSAVKYPLMIGLAIVAIGIGKKLVKKVKI